MNTSLIVGVPQTGFFHHIKEEIGKIVDGILTLTVCASYYRCLDHEITSMVLADLLGKQEYMLRALRREAEQEFAGSVRSDSTLLHVTPVIRVEILVQSAKGESGVETLEVDRRVSQP